MIRLCMPILFSYISHSFPPWDSSHPLPLPMLIMEEPRERVQPSINYSLPVLCLPYHHHPLWPNGSGFGRYPATRHTSCSKWHGSATKTGNSQTTKRWISDRNMPQHEHYNGATSYSCCWPLDPCERLTTWHPCCWQVDRPSLSRLNAVKHVLYISSLEIFLADWLGAVELRSAVCVGQLGLLWMTRGAEAWCIDGGRPPIVIRSSVSRAYQCAPSNRTETGDSSTTASHPRLLHCHWYASYSCLFFSHLICAALH